jgi:hypothetical protein
LLYKVSFKNKYTKDKWLSQNTAHQTLKGAKGTAKYIKSNHGEHGEDLHTQTKIYKIKGTNHRAVVNSSGHVGYLRRNVK